MHEHSFIPDSKAKTLTLLSVLVSILIFIAKLLAYFITKSVAIYSDAMESIVNIISATIAFLGTKIALRPPDKMYPYGYTKFEYFVSMVEAFFIIGAAMAILWKAYQHLLNPEIFKNLDVGFSLIFITMISNTALSYYVYKRGKKENSPILISHASHLFTDVITSAGIIIGVYIAHITGFLILDPIIALIVSINVLYLGYKIIKASIISLLDVSLPQDKIDSIQEIIKNTIKTFPHQNYDIYDVHDFKTRRSGRKGFVEFHLTVSGNMPVREAHNLCDELEKKITDKFPELSVTIHIEPEEEKK
ncbi:MAG: cation-efflux pump [Thermodesulfobacterium geofontis]|uniref:Cation-efflux pump n=1 Tax=Thermodesulfobacterium geofontis TaxID=1295609 RepID=A0A2N7Q9N4_9BACT|nr:MAG: cation-efflux pump [Thermodesulfobacterium geofontis]HEM56505.1 cation transporter [Thermodesulfobium narugense]